MDLRQLKYFVATAEERSFSRAAQRLNIVQSAVSHQIAQLEAETGVRLFDRTSRSVRMTPGGELLLPRARSVLSEVESALTELAELTGLIVGQLRVGMSTAVGFAYPMADECLGQFHRDHPGVDVNISDADPGQLATDVVAGELDLAFVDLPVDRLPTGLAYELIATEPLLAVVASTHPLAGRSAVRLAELAIHGSFVDMAQPSGLRQQVDAAFERAGVTRRVSLELGSAEAAVRFAASDFGGVIVPRSATASLPRSLRVLELEEAPNYDVGLIVKEPGPSTPSGRAFLQRFEKLRLSAQLDQRPPITGHPS